MDTKTKPRFMFDIVSLLCMSFKIHFSLGADTISVDDVLSKYSTIVSAGGVFEMGLFQPGRAPNYYAGIWHRDDPLRRVVWVANREKPVPLSSELRISDGNLVLFDESKTPIWSTNVKNSTTSGRVRAVLLDTGNLVLNDGSDSSNPLWQSFDNPSHAWLPGAKMRYNKVTNKSQALTSWTNSEDPAPGLFSLELNPSENSFDILWNGSQRYWTSGSWDANFFSNLPDMRMEYIFVFNFVSNENESYFTYSLKNSSTITCYFVMDVSGQIKQINWQPTKGWNLFWSLPTQQCDVFALCGVYGSCSEKSSCGCLPGFKPKSQNDWDLKEYSGGCVRKTKLQCGNNATLTNGESERDRFLEIPSMSLPEYKQHLETGSLADCESKCLHNCSCTAYVHDSVGCSIWMGDLLNLKLLEEGDSSRTTLYVRIAASDYRRLKGSSQKWKIYVLLFGIIAPAMFITCTACFIYHLRRRKMAKKRGTNRRNIQENHPVSSYDSENHITDLIRSGQFRENEKNGIHVPFVSLESILAATDNFSDANKLGQGGFGPVYKGKFSKGQEIAIKRLSSASRQGLQELKNEVLLIAKLQHRNLVKLLGYCVEGDEKILLYEYLPNKSLDSFLFDQQMHVSMSWEIRFKIILGIARGLHYLHHDSRLRVIHRDLKTSNILLDEEMNPKISDFGLARIFGVKQIEANTTRVVGTYGYMSPEYALEGLFSIKSDVFSFGVVILEIISGKRNTGFYQSELAMSLLGHAWKLWTENKAMDLIDVRLHETCKVNEFLRCVGVGLLCVQEDPINRPNMSSVLSMLGSESANIPSPKQPAFLVRRSPSKRASFSDKPLSSNELTDTLNEGR